MPLALEPHPHARAILGPALDRGRVSHAYLFHGPSGAGKREIARRFAAELLARGSADPGSARARALTGTHPDLTWVTPSGAHEILVSDIDRAVVAAATRTPFEAACRVFVIESADLLGDAAANRMLKTLEEPPAYVHLILVSDRAADVLATIASRCQLVRFNGPDTDTLTEELLGAGVPEAVAPAIARLSLGEAGVARVLAGPDGAALRIAAEEFAEVVLNGRAAAVAPWTPVLRAVRARGEAAVRELEAAEAAELELVAKKDASRVRREWEERRKRIRRRVETGALGLVFTLLETWLLDLCALAWGAPERVRNVDRLDVGGARAGLSGPATAASVPVDALLRAVTLVEATRSDLTVNVNEELALEALAYRMEGVLAR